MSFMFKPLAYDEPNAVNKIQLKDDVRQNFIRGNEIIAKTMITTMQTAMRDDCYVLCMDGYVSAQFGSMVEALQKAAKENQTDLYVYDMWDIYKTQAQIDELTKESLPLNYEDDPVLLFGRLYKGNIENFIDPAKQAEVVQTLKERKKGIHLIYGMGSASEAIRKAANGIAYLDVTPKVAAIRAREEKFVNIGDESARPFNLLMRRNYFVDFEVTLRSHFSFANIIPCSISRSRASRPRLWISYAPTTNRHQRQRHFLGLRGRHGLPRQQEEHPVRGPDRGRDCCEGCHGARP